MIMAQKKGKKILFALIGFALIAAVGIGVAVYLRKNWNDFEFRYAGTLEATRVDISARVPSTIKSIQVQEGQKVRTNDEVVSLSCEDIDIALAFANQNYDRAENLLRAGNITKESFDGFKSRKEDADLKKSWCVITSPIDGVVMNRFFEPGEFIAPGMKILSVANPKDVWAYIYVPQTEVHNIKAGQELKAVVPEIPGREFVGVIRKINSEAEFTPKNVQTKSERTRLIYGVKLSFSQSNSDEILKPGMTIEVSLPKE